ncbi:hypothetical protein PIB30_078200 [Stylosanthes scabra]|uniref:Uncharacterized protein n=1 Tax=Stylosanthes scabra TaxID=79078 RepID=A0ABU6VP90_9FABA|nr:hypothetical protein [Stylosanthes scabra]
MDVVMMMMKEDPRGDMVLFKASDLKNFCFYTEKKKYPGRRTLCISLIVTLCLTHTHSNQLGTLAPSRPISSPRCGPSPFDHRLTTLTSIASSQAVGRSRRFFDTTLFIRPYTLRCASSLQYSDAVVLHRKRSSHHVIDRHASSSLRLPLEASPPPGGPSVVTRRCPSRLFLQLRQR